MYNAFLFKRSSSSESGIFDEIKCDLMSL